MCSSIDSTLRITSIFRWCSTPSLNPINFACSIFRLVSLSGGRHIHDHLFCAEVDFYSSYSELQTCYQLATVYMISMRRVEFARSHQLTTVVCCHLVVGEFFILLAPPLMTSPPRYLPLPCCLDAHLEPRHRPVHIVVSNMKSSLYPITRHA